MIGDEEHRKETYQVNTRSKAATAGALGEWRSSTSELKEKRNLKCLRQLRGFYSQARRRRVR